MKNILKINEIKMEDEHSLNICKNLIELNEEIYNEDEDYQEEEDDEKSRKELMYDIIQDNLSFMKRSLLLYRKRLIDEKKNSSSLKIKKNDNSVDNINSLNNKQINIKNELIDTKVKTKYQRKKHSKCSLDNLIYKIKVFYHKFIVCLANDLYNNCNNSPSTNNIFVRKISGEITQNCTKTFNMKLGELTLKEFLSKSISSRYTNISENKNRENIEHIYDLKNEYKTLIELLDSNYKDFYQNFYIKDNCVELIEEKFNINKRTYISFKESIQNLIKTEDDDYIIKITETANDKFILLLEGKDLNNKINYN